MRRRMLFGIESRGSPATGGNLHISTPNVTRRLAPVPVKKGQDAGAG